MSIIVGVIETGNIQYHVLLLQQLIPGLLMKMMTLMLHQ